MWKVLEYTPHSAVMLAIVSRSLNQWYGRSMESSVTDIFNRHATGTTLLSRYIQKVKADHENRLEHTTIPFGSSLHDPRSRSVWIAHMSLLKIIRSLGVVPVVPTGILSSGECNQVPCTQNAALQKIWKWRQSCVSHAWTWFSYDDKKDVKMWMAENRTERPPAEDAPVETVMAWMLNPANGPILGKIRELQLTNCELERVPMEIRLYTGLLSLSLPRTSIVSLEPGSFAGLSALQKLDLSQNTLTSLLDWAFLGLSSLRELNLQKNRLDALRPGMLQGAPALQKLDLSQNVLTSLATGAFWGMSALEELSLQKNQLGALKPGVLQEAPALRKLDLSENELTSLEPGIFLGISALVELNLSWNRLTSLEPEVQGLFTLTKLNLMENRLTSIEPGAFLKMSALQELDLSWTGLTSLEPGRFLGLSALKTLYLDSNQLTVVETGAFQGLDALKVLNLSHNGITSYDFEEIKRLGCLRSFHFSPGETLPSWQGYSAQEVSPDLRQLNLRQLVQYLHQSKKGTVMSLCPPSHRK